MSPYMCDGRSATSLRLGACRRSHPHPHLRQQHRTSATSNRSARESPRSVLLHSTLTYYAILSPVREQSWSASHWSRCADGIQGGEGERAHLLSRDRPAAETKRLRARHALRRSRRFSPTRWPTSGAAICDDQVVGIYSLAVTYGFRDPGWRTITLAAAPTPNMELGRFRTRAEENRTSCRSPRLLEYGLVLFTPTSTKTRRRRSTRRSTGAIAYRKARAVRRMFESLRRRRPFKKGSTPTCSALLRQRDGGGFCEGDRRRLGKPVARVLPTFRPPALRSRCSTSRSPAPTAAPPSP